MSAPASPGRTWCIVAAECELPVLAGAIATGISRDCTGIARIPVLGSETEASVPPNVGNQDHFRYQPVPQRGRDRDLGCPILPLSVNSSVCVISPARDVKMISMRRLAGAGLLAMLMSVSAWAQVEKVLADAEGIT